MKFQLINKSTGLTFNQHKAKHPIRMYYGLSCVFRDDFRDAKCWPMIRHDGAICFQRKITDYDQGELYFLHRDDWELRLKGEEDDQG
jgi:hypothetical protein